MKKVLLAIFTVYAVSSCILFKPRVETVEKIVTKREVINEKGDAVTLYDTITKTEVRDRWQEREETRREKNSDKYDYKSLMARNKFLKDSLNVVKRQNRNSNLTLRKLESEQTKQDRIHKREVKALQRQATKQIKQKERSERTLYGVFGVLGLLLLALIMFVIRKKKP